MATTSSTIRTTINKIAQNYQEIETGKPILMGHIIYRIIERNMSLAKIAEWASNINKKNGFLSTITKNDVIRADRIYKKWKKVINQKDIEECLSNCEETLIKESSTTQGTYNSTYNSTPSDTAVTNNTDASANTTACMNTKDDSKLVLKLKQKIRRLEFELKYVKNKDKKRKVLRKKLLKKNKSNKRKIEIDDITSRKFHYLCKLHNLPSTTIKSLVSKIYEFFDIKAKVFSKTAYQTMTAELGFMSDFITCQSLLKSEDATIIFYATTKDGHHFNNIIFCTEKSSYVASVQRLAGGTARDYSSHIFETIKKLSKSYALVSGENIECIRQNLISKIKCCLTDRAPVNHSTIFLLENKWQKNLIELNCNIHPLEAMTKDVCKSLKSFEDTSVHNLGFHQIQCIGQSIITHFNTLRYNNNKGLIKELKNFMNENFSKSIIPRFRGNRINIIFHLSFIYFVHKDKFLEFLKSHSQIKPLCRQLETAFGNDIACLELKVLGIIGKLLSGPWMSTFYTSLKDQHSVTDGITIVKDLLDRLGMLVQDPIKVPS